MSRPPPHVPPDTFKLPTLHDTHGTTAVRMRLLPTASAMTSPLFSPLAPVLDMHHQDLLDTFLLTPPTSPAAPPLALPSPSDLTALTTPSGLEIPLSPLLPLPTASPKRKRRRSNFCHVCGSRAKARAFAPCERCYRLVCKECIRRYRWGWETVSLGEWECTHCKNACPDVALCRVSGRPKRDTNGRKEGMG